MRTLHLLLFLALTASGAAQTFERTTSIYFPSAGYELPADAMTELDQWASALTAYADVNIRLEAFTDEQGSTSYNERLARRRAASVSRVLDDYAIATSGLEVLTHGEQLARRGTNNDAERRNDRRVDLVATITPHTSTVEVTEEWRGQQTQTETIDPTKLGTVIGEKGGVFFIDPNTLVYPDGRPVTGPVTVHLRESYALSDMVLSGLSTLSGDRLLETGGMFELSATDAEGRPLRLAEGKTIAGALPTQEFREGMRIFSGSAPAADGTPTDWATAPGDVARDLVDLPVPTSRPMPPGDIHMYEELILPILIGRWDRENPRFELATDAFSDNPPRRPREPDSTKVYYPAPKGIKSLFANQRELDEKNAARRKQEQQRYLDRLARWERATVAYHQKKAAYEAKMVANEEATDLLKVRRDSFIQATKAGIGKRYEREIAAIEAEIAAWRAEKTQLMAQYRRDRLALSVASGNELEQSAAATAYFVSVSNLGWINCDRFLNVEDPVEVLANLDNAPTEAFVMLIPEGTRSLLPLLPRRGTGQWAVSGLPRDLGYAVITYYVREGQLVLGFERVPAGTTSVALSVEPVSMEALPGRLSALLGS